MRFTAHNVPFKSIMSGYIKQCWEPNYFSGSWKWDFLYEFPAIRLGCIFPYSYGGQ
jgi:hypothetical protein